MEDRVGEEGRHLAEERLERRDRLALRRRGRGAVRVGLRGKALHSTHLGVPVELPACRRVGLAELDGRALDRDEAAAVPRHVKLGDDADAAVLGVGDEASDVRLREEVGESQGNALQGKGRAPPRPACPTCE